MAQDRHHAALAAPAWARRCSNIGALLVPALSLSLPSGYSWGAALILVAALLSAPLWLRRRPSPSTTALALCIAAMAALLLLDVNLAAGWSTLDRPLKFVLAVPCVLFLGWCGASVGWLAAGVLLGAAGAGATALAQWHGCQAGLQGLQGLQIGSLFSAERCWGVLSQTEARVSGYTNAIQFGDIALLLAMMSLVALAVQWRRWTWAWRFGWMAAAALALEASLLSMARGGWLAIGVALPFAAYVAVRWAAPRAVLAGALGAIALVGALVAVKGDDLGQRAGLAWRQAQLYQLQGDAESSVGHRLAHWSLAWDMARERPWTGWTQAGYEQEKARRVAAGTAPPVVLRFAHAHNEVLDMLVKRGVVGLAALTGLYLVPLAVFWPTRARVSLGPGLSAHRTVLGLRVAGTLLPLACMGFGLTQVFFAHNSGVMFYLFMVALVHAALASARPSAR